MRSPSPYDLNAKATRRRCRREQSKPCSQKRDNRNYPDSPSPYDLSSHGGLAGLADKARQNPKF